MSKQFYILNNSRVVYTPGHYDPDDARRLAKQWAERHPGRTYRVVETIDMYHVKKEKKS